MQRVSVVGSSGSGKTTVARRLADALVAPHVELDALFWGPDWSEVGADDFAERVLAATGGDVWVVDGNYQSKIGMLVWDRADTVVWLNPPRWRAMVQVVGRTVRRAATGEELWSGNRETWRGLRFWRGEESILWWAWTSYGRTRDRYEEAMRAAPSTGPHWHRLRTRRDVERFLQSASPPSTDP
jgi:adenylate kinase family enzyme